MIELLGDSADRSHSVLRYVGFGVAIVLAVSGLTARLFYLEIANGTPASPAAAVRASVTEAIAAPRGMIYDRTGRRPSRSGSSGFE